MATTRYLFDTSAFIDYWRRRPNVRDYFDSVLDGNAVGYYSIITEAELWAGVDSKSKARDHEIMLRAFNRIGLDSGLARGGGRMSGQYKLLLPDALIAATARHFGLTLLTRNINDFQAVQNVISCQFYRN